ncbi:MAG: hypothetical protein ACLFVD_04360 [Dehalococcoidia bacterium]
MISPDGYAVTSKHVVAVADRVTVTPSSVQTMAYATLEESPV